MFVHMKGISKPSFAFRGMKGDRFLDDSQEHATCSEFSSTELCWVYKILILNLKTEHLQLRHGSANMTHAA